MIEKRRVKDNTKRPQGALGWRPPAPGADSPLIPPNSTSQPMAVTMKVSHFFWAKTSGRLWLKGQEDPKPAKTDQYGRWRELLKVHDQSQRRAPISANWLKSLEAVAYERFTLYQMCFHIYSIELVG